MKKASKKKTLLSEKHTDKVKQWASEGLKTHWRLLFICWYILIALSSALGVRSLLTRDIQPLYLTLSILVPSLLLLILSFIRINALFPALFMFLSRILLKIFNQPMLPKNTTAAHLYPYFIRFISHSTWGVIFLTLIICFFISFSFQDYHFYLGTTLFAKETSFYDSWIHSLDLLPAWFGLTPLDDQTIHNTLQNTLTKTQQGQWASWVLIMLFFYGFMPRLLLTAYYFMRIMLIRTRADYAQIGTTGEVIDKAVKKPQIMRPVKKIITGSGDYLIALDIPKDSIATTNIIQYLNDIDSFSQFEHKLQQLPAQALYIIVDANQTPDRGTLRRIIRLLDLSASAVIYAYSIDPTKSRFYLWQQHLSPLLQAQEQLSELFDSLEH